MADTSLNVPAGFGGLMRYNEEYESKFNISPAGIITFVVLITAFRVFLSWIY